MEPNAPIPLLGDPPEHPVAKKNGSWIIDGILVGENEQCATWVHQVLGGGLIEVGYKGFGIVSPDLPNGRPPDTLELKGGVYFWGYQNDSQCDIITSVAVSSDVMDGMHTIYASAIRQLLDYPFGFLKLPRISAEISMDNTDAIQAAAKMGFVLEGRKRKKLKNGGDVGMFGLCADRAQMAGFWQPYE